MLQNRMSLKRDTERLNPSRRLSLVVFSGCIWSVVCLPSFGGSATPTDGFITPLVLKTSKAPSVPLISARNQAFSASSGTSDTFDAVGSAQDVTGAWAIDDQPDTHSFGTGQQDAGANLLSNAAMAIVGSDLGPGTLGSNFIQVNYFTTDLSDIIPAGATSPDGQAFHSWRLDVGTGLAGSNSIDLPYLSNITVVDSGYCLLDGGEIVGCVELSSDDSSTDGVAGIGVAGLDGSDIAGSGIDEMIMFWEVQAGPICGDGNVDEDEECDDGNTNDNDGCSSTCQIEADLSPADLDRDGDVDLHDYAIFVTMFTGPTGAAQ